MKTTSAKLFKNPIGWLMVFAFVVLSGGSVQADPPGYGFPGRPPVRRPEPPRPPARPLPPGPGARPADPRQPLPPHPQPPTGGPRRPIPVGRAIVVRPAMTGHEDEIRAVRIFQAATAEGRCERIGESLRRISNAILNSASEANARDDGTLARDPRGLARLRIRESWRRTLQSRVFWDATFSRLMDIYRSCDATCMEDGEAIGLLSGTVYCAANVGVGGLYAPGFLAQNSIPMCGTSVFLGCQTGYRQAVTTYAGCDTYTRGAFERVFLESISQDCHIEE